VKRPCLSCAYDVQRQRGAALVIVLWLIVLLTIIAAGHTYNARIEMRLAARQLETARSRAIAEAATQLTIARLLAPEAAKNLFVDGRTEQVNVLNRSVTVSVRRASGLVDLNSADQTLLESLFAAGGASPQLAPALAARVLDWRDADSLKHLNGAEDADYRIAGLAWTARDDRFTTVEELRYVLGMPPGVFRAVSPYLTVHSNAAGVDPNLAPEFLLNIFGDRSNGERRLRDIETSRAALGGDGIFHINVAVPGENDVFVSSETIVRVARSAESQFTILSWRDRSRALTQAREGARI